MSYRIPALLAAAALLSACSSGSGTSPGNIIYDTDNPSPVANFANGYVNPLPTDGTIARVQYDEGSDTLTITDPNNPNSATVVQTSTGGQPALQNLRTYIAGASIADIPLAPGQPFVMGGSEIEVATLNTDERNSWALSVRETAIDSTNPNFTSWTDVGTSAAFGGDIYTSAIADRGTAPTATATMNGTYVYTGAVFTEAILVGRPNTGNGTADVGLLVDFANDTIGGTVTNFTGLDARTGGLPSNSSVDTTVFTLPTSTIAADGTFTGTSSEMVGVAPGIDNRDISFRGQINGPLANEASGAIAIEQVTGVQFGSFFITRRMTGTFVAEE